MEALARYIKVLGDGNRLAIIGVIGTGAVSVSEIIRRTGLSQTLVSFHLRALRRADVVRARREGPFVYYRLRRPELLDVLARLAAVAGLEAADSGGGERRYVAEGVG